MRFRLAILVAGLLVFARPIELHGATPAPPRAAASGDRDSDPFDLYLGPGFLFHPPGGVGSSSSGAFDAYLAAPYRAGGATAFGFAQASALDLYLPRLSEGSGLSPLFVFDPGGSDPGIPFPPIHVSATPIPCTSEIDVAWVPSSTGVQGYEIWRGYRPLLVFGPPQYTYLTTVGPQFLSFPDHPAGGNVYYYRIRSIRNGILSAFSDPAQVTAPALGTPQAPLDFRARNAGEPMFGPPANQYSIAVSMRLTRPAGLTIQIQQNTSPNFAGVQPMEVQPTKGPFGLFSDVFRYTFQGTAGTTYWFRARTTNACGQQSDWSSAIPVVPGRLPVVFVHGIWEHQADWGNGFVSTFTNRGFRIDKAIEFKDKGGRFTDWGSELDDYVTGLLKPGGRFDNDERVDIVSHSQGGLASRYFVEKLTGKDKVRTLVMIGTPNHGGLYARLADLFRVICRADHDDTCPVYYKLSPGVQQLDTHSDALLGLNFPGLQTKDDIHGDSPIETGLSDRGSVVYYTIAGSGPTSLSCAVPNPIACHRNQAKDIDDLGEHVEDGVVPVTSVRLRGLLAGFNWVDVQIPGVGGLVHSHGLETPLYNSTAEMLSVPLSGFVADRLDRLPVAAPEAEPSVASRVRASVGAGRRSPRLGSDPSPRLVAAVKDSVGPSATFDRCVHVDTCGALTLYAGSELGSLRIRARSPSGRLISADDAVPGSGIAAESNDSLGYAALEIEQPEPGCWSVLVDAPGSTGMTTFEADWVVTGGEYSATGIADRAAGGPGQLVRFHGGLAKNGGAVAAGGTVTLIGVSGIASTTPLFDDGTHGDSLAADGDLSAMVPLPAAPGVYTAQLAFAGAPFDEAGPHRLVETSISVSRSPDLVVDTLSASMTPVPAQIGVPCAVRFTLYNRGNAPADSIDVTLSDPSVAESIGEQVLALAPGDSASIQFSWVPSVAGDHPLAALARIGGDATDADPLDNAASFNATVLPGLPTTAVDEALPLRIDFAAPFPNPAAGASTFAFALPAAAPVHLDVFDVQGRLVASLIDRVVPAGRHRLLWTGGSAGGAPVAIGIYFARFRASGYARSRKLVMLR